MAGTMASIPPRGVRGPRFDPPSIVFVSADETDDEEGGGYLEEEPEEVKNAWEELVTINKNSYFFVIDTHAK